MDYKTDKYWLMMGDCIERMKEIPDESVNLVLCDPPFGTTRNKWDNIIEFKAMWESITRILKPNGAFVLFGAEPFSSNLRISNIRKFKYDWIWNKILKTGHLNSKIMPMGQHENISVFGCKGKVNYYPIMEEGKPEHSRGDKRKKGNMDSNNYGKQSVDFVDKTGNTKKYPSTLSINIQKVHPSKCIHTTQKPIKLMEYLIKTYTIEGDTVCDFCVGSGATTKASVNLNRYAIGIDNGFCEKEKSEHHTKSWIEIINETLLNSDGTIKD
jgi:DNA modification methylase